MKGVDHDELLRMLTELAEITEQHDHVVPADAVLRQYLAGDLEGDERRQVESLLSRSPQARERLGDLAGGIEGPPTDMRERILAHTPRPVRRRRWLPVAAGLAAAVLLAAVMVQLQLRQTPHLTGYLCYEIAAVGLVETRGETEDSTGISAFPETRVPIAVVPRGDATTDVELGLYGERNGRLERLDRSPEVTRSLHRGRATFSAPASVLVGTQPGEHTVYVVVAMKGDLPGSLRLKPGEEPVPTLSSGDRRKVYQQTISVLLP